MKILPFTRSPKTIEQSLTPNIPTSNPEPANEKPIKQLRFPRLGSLIYGFTGGMLGTGATMLILPAIDANYYANHYYDGEPPSKEEMLRELTIQGFEPNALSPERLKEREEIAASLSNNSPISIDGFSDHLIALGKYAKPAVVVISDPQYKDIARGSGFIYDSNGLIITNAHVVEAIPSNPLVSVNLYDGRKADGLVIGMDKEKDIAVVKIFLEDSLPTLSLASTKAESGSFVMAVGFQPPIFGWSLTSGILSATNRDLPKIAKNMLQTDTAINKGSSGGPLINIRGEVIGMSTAIVRSAMIDNLGFGVPASDIEKFVSSIVTDNPTSLIFLNSLNVSY